MDLTAFAGKTTSKLWVGSSTATPVGSWNIYYGEIAIYSADGTVTPIYNRASSEGFSYWTGGGETGTAAAVQRSNVAEDAEQPGNTTAYYLSDQIDSTRLMVAAGGWPVSQDTYYPFGVEPYPQADQNHYKFSGKERDAETGNDDFGARYYGPIVGRFMSPDFSDTPEAMPYADPANPQSFNRYVYMNNNPLGGIDPDGHDWDKAWQDLRDVVAQITAKVIIGVGVGAKGSLLGMNARAELADKDNFTFTNGKLSVSNSLEGGVSAGAAKQVGLAGSVTKVAGSYDAKDNSFGGSEPAPCFFSGGFDKTCTLLAN